jgi:hypothetical protein
MKKHNITKKNNYRTKSLLRSPEISVVLRNGAVVSTKLFQIQRFPLK